MHPYDDTALGIWESAVIMSDGGGGGGGEWMTGGSTDASDTRTASRFTTLSHSLATTIAVMTYAIPAAIAGRFLLSFTSIYDSLKYDHLLTSPLTSYSRRAQLFSQMICSLGLTTT